MHNWTKKALDEYINSPIPYSSPSNRIDFAEIDRSFKSTIGYPTIPKNNPQPLKERETMNANFDPIVKLARGKAAVVEDATFGLPDNNSAIADALKELLAEEEKTTVRAAAQEIVKVAKAAEAKREQLVEQIRAARAAEARAKEQLNDLSVAHAYAGKTMNYLPLAMAASMNIPSLLLSQFRELFFVPPQVPPVPAKTVKKTTSGK